MLGENNMTPHRDLIVNALLTPEIVRELSAQKWDLLIRQGRRTNLLARLANVLTQQGLLENAPIAARHHLTSAVLVAERQSIALRWEVECIRQALAYAGIKPILLKGAAYVMAGLEAARGRTFSDVDIIVPKKLLGETESALMIHGWQGSHHDKYDQRYYRRWMHEIPPMRHVKRGTTIDVHHTILPETARLTVNPAALLAAIVPVKDFADLYVLQPTDMLLHSATHLFHEGDFESSLRDLFDLDCLFRQFSALPDFSETLALRAATLGLSRPLYYAVRYTTLILDTPVPEVVRSEASLGKPSALISWVMDICYLNALRPVHSSTNSFSAWLARFALYIRSHWIRMPFPLLAYHLGRKAFIRSKSYDIEKSVADADLKA